MEGDENSSREAEVFGFGRRCIHWIVGFRMGFSLWGLRFRTRLSHQSSVLVGLCRMLNVDFTKSFDNCLTLPCFWSRLRGINLGLLGGGTNNHETKIDLDILPTGFYSMFFFQSAIAFVKFGLSAHGARVQDIRLRQFGNSVHVLMEFSYKTFVWMAKTKMPKCTTLITR